MLSTKTRKGSNPKKPARKQNSPQNPRLALYKQFQDETRETLVKYDSLIDRAKENAEKRARIQALAKTYTDLRNVQLELLVHENPLIHDNITFGKISSKGEDPIRYGFTCVLSKAGDKEVIPVPSSDRVLLDARNMILTGMLEVAYKKLSKQLYEERVRQKDAAYEDSVRKFSWMTLDQIKKLGDSIDAHDLGAAV
jgi:hypothetical protein